MHFIRLSGFIAHTCKGIEMSTQHNGGVCGGSWSLLYLENDMHWVDWHGGWMMMLWPVIIPALLLIVV